MSIDLDNSNDFKNNPNKNKFQKKNINGKNFYIIYFMKSKVKF